MDHGTVEPPMMEFYRPLCAETFETSREPEPAGSREILTNGVGKPKRFSSVLA